jgi:hypothetical protein
MSDRDHMAAGGDERRAKHRSLSEKEESAVTIDGGGDEEEFRYEKCLDRRGGDPAAVRRQRLCGRCQFNDDWRDAGRDVRYKWLCLPGL